jgi:hypothetical protein
VSRRPKQLRFTADFLRRHSKTKRGAIGSPFRIFLVAENYRPHTITDLRTIIVELDVYDDAKLGGGGAGPSNAGDSAGRAMKRDLSFAARQGALSSGQG